MIDEVKILAALKNVYDPDLQKDIVSLGFIKDLKISKSNDISFDLELTTPACPVKDMLKDQCIKEIKKIDSSVNVCVNLTAQTRGIEIPKNNVAIAQVKNIVAVASGKGGVGKSTAAVQLARSLAKEGAKVGILDADIHGPSIVKMFDAPNPTETSGKMVVPPLVDGIRVISIGMFAQKATILRGPMTAQIIKQFLTEIYWGELDYLIIDYPPGTGDIQLTISQLVPLSGAVLVTTPQDVALIDVDKAVEMFATMKVPVVGIIENMSYFVCDGCDKKHRIFGEGGGVKLSKKFGIPLIGEIPISPALCQSLDSGKWDENNIATKGYREASSQVIRALSTLHLTRSHILENFKLEWNA